MSTFRYDFGLLCLCLLTFCLSCLWFDVFMCCYLCVLLCICVDMLFCFVMFMFCYVAVLLCSCFLMLMFCYVYVCGVSVLVLFFLVMDKGIKDMLYANIIENSWFAQWFAHAKSSPALYFWNAYQIYWLCVVLHMWSSVSRQIRETLSLLWECLHFVLNSLFLCGSSQKSKQKLIFKHLRNNQYSNTYATTPIFTHQCNNQTSHTYAPTNLQTESQ